VTTALATKTYRPEIEAFGVVQEDPSQSFTLRAPLPGTITKANESDWPRLGDVLPDGAVVGILEPRLSPTDRVDLASKLASAKADVEADLAVLEQDRLSFERLKALNAEEKSVSDRALQEAQAKVKGDEARVKAAKETAVAIESATSASAGAPGALPLVLRRGGQVVDVQMNVGENAESGQAILRVARYDSVLVAVSAGIGQNVDISAGSTATITPAGDEKHRLQGKFVGLAPAVDPKTLGQTLLFRVEQNPTGLRPGMAVSAKLPRADTAEKPGMIVPQHAVVYYGGKPWVYVQKDQQTFTRREIMVDAPTDDGFFVPGGLAGNNQKQPRIVTVGAQTLLSEELKSNIQISS